MPIIVLLFQVVKPFKEGPTVTAQKDLLNESSLNAVTSVSSQLTQWDNKHDYKSDQGPRRQHLPSDRTQGPERTNHCGPRSQTNRGPHQNRTKMPAYNGGTVPSSAVTTMVTATASVTVAVHPSLPGAYHGYMHEGYVDSESDCFEDTKRTSQSCGKATQSSKRESLEVEDLESVQNQHQANQAQGESHAEAKTPFYILGLLILW